MKDEVSGRTFLEATIIEGLKFKTSFNFDLINYNTLDYTNPKLGPAKENGGGVSRLNTRTFSWTWNNIVTYDKTIGEHHFNVLAGMESYSYRYDELTASRSKMAQPDMPELVVGSQLTGGSGYRIDYALVGYLTQLLYDYRNKYFFSASYRRVVLPVLHRRLVGETSGHWVLMACRSGKFYGFHFRLAFCPDVEDELWCARK